jgi:hypothetical protein
MLPSNDRHPVNMAVIMVVVSMMVTGLGRKTKGNQSYQG